jgi:uncharacterized membrane protein
VTNGDFLRTGVAAIVKIPLPFVMIGQNRQAAFQQTKADHDFHTQELELHTNTELTRQIHVLTTELHRHVLGQSASDDESPQAVDTPGMR